VRAKCRSDASVSLTPGCWRAASIRPGPNRLDDLCLRYGIDSSARTPAPCSMRRSCRGLSRAHWRSPGAAHSGRGRREAGRGALTASIRMHRRCSPHGFLPTTSSGMLRLLQASATTQSGGNMRTKPYSIRWQQCRVGRRVWYDPCAGQNRTRAVRNSGLRVRASKWPKPDIFGCGRIGANVCPPYMKPFTPGSRGLPRLHLCHRC
jgi:hypothetical protein